MAADLDMEAAGGEGWGDDAELTMVEGKFRIVLAIFSQKLPFRLANWDKF